MTAALVAASAGGLHAMLDHAFMRNAFVAGTAVAAVCGVLGWFVVLRGQVFSADALSHVAFTGALAALAAGADARVGLFAGTVVVAAGMGVLGRRGRTDDVVVGTVLTAVLGIGVLFAGIYASSASAPNGAAGVNVLFGSIFGLDRGQAYLAAAVAAGICLALAVIARPLLFASVDEAVAAARGVPVRALGAGFLVLVGAGAAEATQAVGALLLVGLLAAPAGAAQRLTARPGPGIACAVAIATGSVWIGLTISYLDGALPPSFSIMAVVTAVYALTFVPRGRAPATAGGSRAPRRTAPRAAGRPAGR